MDSLSGAALPGAAIAVSWGELSLNVFALLRQKWCDNPKFWVPILGRRFIATIQHMEMLHIDLWHEGICTSYFYLHQTIYSTQVAFSSKYGLLSESVSLWLK